MIAKYKSTPWLLSAAFALLLIALAGLTFTRAAERRPAAAVAAPPARSKSLDVLSDEVAKQEQIVRKLQMESDKLAEALGAMEPPDTDALQKLSVLHAEANAELTRLSSLYKHLTQLERPDMLHAINTVVPDQQLSQLMQQRDLAEQKYADLLEDRAPEHPDVKRIARVLAQIAKQIDSRIEGIRSGMKAKLDAQKAHVEALDTEMELTRRRHVDRSIHNRPYQELLQELHAQQEILQRLRLRMADERISNALERAKEK